MKNEVLTEVCNSLATEITDLTQKIENLELGASKKMVTVSGLTLNSNNKEDKIHEMEVFFRQILENTCCY